MFVPERHRIFRVGSVAGRIHKFAFVLVLTALPFSAPAFAAEVGATKSIPLGFRLFCLKNPNECKATKNVAAVYSTKLMRRLSLVNISINRAITPGKDRLGTDTWSLNVAVGDCEDYVVTKRSALTRAGIPAGALRIATAMTPSSQGHAVLIVKTTKGDLVLDNLTDAILPKPESGLRFVAISEANPLRWTSDV